MRIIKAIAWGFLAGLMPNVCEAATGSEIDRLINALIRVESNGDTQAIGDGGKALGVLQIHLCVLQDVNRIYGTSYVLADRADAEKSKEICRLYLAYWGKQYQKTAKKQPTNELYSRIWNGGPRGYLKNSTVKYWHRVRRELESNQ